MDDTTSEMLAHMIGSMDPRDRASLTFACLNACYASGDFQKLLNSIKKGEAKTRAGIDAKLMTEALKMVINFGKALLPVVEKASKHLPEGKLLKEMQGGDTSALGDPLPSF